MAKKNATQPRRVIPIVIIIIMEREREIIIIHLAINIDIRRQSISGSSCCGPSAGRTVVRSSITSHWPQKFPLESPCLFYAKQFLLSIPVQVTSNSCPFNHKVNGIETHTHTHKNTSPPEVVGKTWNRGQQPSLMERVKDPQTFPLTLQFFFCFMKIQLITHRKYEDWEVHIVY